MEHASARRRVVVGVDGSPPSQRAAAWAAREASDRGAGLDVVHVWSVPYQTYPEGGYIDPAPLEEESRAIADGVIESLATTGPLPTDVRPVVVRGDAASALLEAAAGADLLVVGSRGHGGFVGLLLGSVSQRCVEHASGPVAVVPPAWASEDSRRIVVGVDGSEPSYGALHWAVVEAARRSARLDVVHVYDSPAVVSAFAPGRRSDPDELEKASRKLLEEMVDGARSRAAEPPELDLIPAPGRPAATLLEAARGADLLVVGSRGRGAFKGLVLGSVSQQCVHHAPCPVVVVR